jgi:hypothetical protein
MDEVDAETDTDRNMTCLRDWMMMMTMMSTCANLLVTFGSFSYSATSVSTPLHHFMLIHGAQMLEGYAVA